MCHELLSYFACLIVFYSLGDGATDVTVSYQYYEYTLTEFIYMYIKKVMIPQTFHHTPCYSIKIHTQVYNEET